MRKLLPRWLPVLMLSVARGLPAFSTSDLPAANVSVKVEAFSGTDLGAKIAAANEALGSRPGVITVNTVSTLKTATTLSARHNLMLNAPVTWAATMKLSGSNDISCVGGGAISSTVPAGMPIFSAKDVSQIVIHGCVVSMTNDSPVLDGEGVRRVSMHHLKVEGGTIAQINGRHGSDAGGAATELDFDHNTVVDAAGTSGAAILLVNTTMARVDSNSFTGIAYGTQWWGGDSATGNASQVTRTGKITLSGNRCQAVSACLWGSMGYEIAVTGNTADGCGDVCFDTEGGLSSVFNGNTATNCANGCGAVFFFGRGVSFTKNTFSGDSRGGGLFLIKNQSANPASYSGLTVSSNTLTCATICNAVYQEAVGQATFDGNVVSNGVFATAGFGQDVTISRNSFSFSRSLAAGGAAIKAPSITGATTLTVEGNSVSSTVPQVANTACISATWNDYNNSDTYYIKGNRCEGAAPFPIDIVTMTDGANPGMHASWHVESNFGAGGRIVHTRRMSNEVYLVEGNCTPAGCPLK